MLITKKLFEEGPPCREGFAVPRKPLGQSGLNPLHPTHLDQIMAMVPMH